MNPLDDIMLIGYWKCCALVVSLVVVVAERCTVHTFFEELTGGINFQSNKKVHMDRQDHLHIVQIWLRNWFAGGWNPRLLRLRHAMSYPGFEQYHRKFARLPTVNWRAYEMTCYLRWLAFAEAGGGVFVDYDIMNFPVSRIPIAAGQCGQGELLISYPKYWPMLLFGNRTATERLIRALAEYEADPERDVYDGKPHISDMIIVRNMGEHLLDLALPNPRNLWHFASIQKRNLAVSLEESSPEAASLLSSMSRSEWIRHTLTIAFIQRNRLYIWAADGHNIDQALSSLLKPLSECPERGTTKKQIIHEDSRLTAGEYPVCDYRKIDRLTEWESLNEWTIMFVESVEESVLRSFLKTHGSKQFSFDVFQKFSTQEANQNKLLKTLLKKDVPSGEDLAAQLEHVKSYISTRKNLVIGLLDRLVDSKMLLEYSLGFILPNLSEPYVPPSKRHSINLTTQEKDVILRQNWADVELIAFLRSLWAGRLKEVLTVESQLEQYHDHPLSYNLSINEE